MGEQVSILELANNMIKLSGFVPDKDIKVTFSGIRPGEKLEEKLFWENEESLPTNHKKIMMVKNREFNYEEFIKDTGVLKTSINSGDLANIHQMLTDISQKYLG
jgi:FlaA1/EpsC-like NDP-sugar epimerase